ncbi:DNA-binding protein [Natronococcus pandeyae]|uniref:DNA-binding protein n=1 Tax=Natronococcus pandeyae TaxID=2055836 RepID=A0A8J8Q324_9EURY|nr:helix-turn-helix domain-containing protein [Natronococcus pandeyae]TYL36225.1 DNA-binding protein [Natronococcus pandeyae]
MSTIAELTVPAEEFALGQTLDVTTGLVVEIERVVAYDPDRIMPYVWFLADEATLAEADDALATDSTVVEAELLSDLGDERLYAVDWTDDVTDVLGLLTGEHSTVLEATVENAQWRFRVLFPERDVLSRTYEFATDQGVSIDLQKIHRLDETRHSRFDLTDAQHETLVAALDRGYYDIPRTIDMEELSDELEISHQALSERLRRAHRSLVEEAVGVDDSEDDD